MGTTVFTSFLQYQDNKFDLAEVFYNCTKKYVQFDF